MSKNKLTGIVIYQEPEFWLEIEQRVLDLKKIGIRTNKAKEAARLMKIGLANENAEYRKSDSFLDAILDRDEI